ncbi:hypothetical protein GCM10010470_17620 [Saccharopolyspora taberi]|uniref:Uncharacterized protein n=1 Tax=Saccharopolyspora taberi TaxID=60895 RepID=A0ABN3V9I9_9PSEU
MLAGSVCGLARGTRVLACDTCGLTRSTRVLACGLIGGPRLLPISTPLLIGSARLLTDARPLPGDAWLPTGDACLRSGLRRLRSPRLLRVLRPLRSPARQRDGRGIPRGLVRCLRLRLLRSVAGGARGLVGHVLHCPAPS